MLQVFYILESISRNYAVYLLLVITFFLSIMIYFLGMFSYLFLMIAAFAGSLISYIFIKTNKLCDFPMSYASRHNSDKSSNIINILFVILFVGSVSSLLLETFDKSIWYYIFISCCVFLLVFELMHYKQNYSETSFLFKSFLVVINVMFSNQIAFPGGILMLDGPAHISRLVMPILETGAIQNDGLSLSGYQVLPIHHLLSAETIMVLGTDVMMTYIYMGAALISFSSLCLYLIGRIYKPKIFAGLVLLLFLGLDYYIASGTHPEHCAYNFGISIIPILMAYLYFKRGDMRYLLLFAMTDFLVTLTHHLTSIIVLFVVLCMSMVKFHIREPQRTIHISIYMLPVLLSLCFICVHWMYVSTLFGRFIMLTDMYVSTLTSVFESGGGSGLSGGVDFDVLPIDLIFVNTLGSSLLILVSIVGLIYFLKKNDFFSNVSILIAGTLVVLLGFGIMLSVRGLMPGRLYPHLQVLALVFFAAEGALLLFRSSKYFGGKIGLCFFISLLCFFSLTSTICGFETSPYADGMNYSKLYHPPHDSSADHWVEIHVPEFVTVSSRPSFTNGGNIVNPSQNPANNLVYVDIFYEKIGYHISSLYYGRKKIVKLGASDFEILDMYDKYYENGMGYYVG